MRRTLAGLVLLVVIALIGLTAWEPMTATTYAPPPPADYDGRIVRDEWGVPHIYGKRDVDVGFALAYAHAEDDFATLQEVIAMTRGRAGAMIGPEGMKVSYVLALLDARGTVDRRYNGLSPQVRALLDAYASGLNAYAAKHASEVRLAKLFPVNGKDVATGFVLRSPFFFGLDGVLGALSDDKALPVEMAKPLLPDTMSGSNAFAVAPRKATDGHTRLLSNSHQPWTGGVAWYEMHVQSGEGWHFSGANFPGMPFPALGHNATLGWTNTVDRPDLIDVYKLVLNEDGTRYRYDGKWLPLEKKRVWLRYKIGPLLIPVFKYAYRSVHGPVIVNKSGAWAINYGGKDTIGQLDQYYRLSRARDWSEWSAAMAMHQIPATNFIYADAKGRVALIYNAQFPNRKPGFDYRGILPGDTSRALASGGVPWSMVPQNVDPRSGFIENSNNTPFMAAGPGSELDPKAYSPLLGIETDVTNRALRGVGLMAATPRIGEAELLRIKYDTAYDPGGYAGRWWRAIAAVDPKGDKTIADAKALLARWDWTLDGKGPADALACLMLRPANKANYQRQAQWPDAREELAQWSAHLIKYFGRLDPPLGDLMRLRHGKVDLPLDGGPDTLRAMALWDIDDDGRLRAKHGDSFIMLVDWAPDGSVRSQSIQPFGAATTRPESTHYSDQAALFAQHRMKPVWFWPQDVAAHAKSARRIVATP